MMKPSADPLSAAPDSPIVGRIVSGRSSSDHSGPFFQVTLHVSDDLVANAEYSTFNCIWANMIGLAAMSRLKGRPLASCRDVGEKDLVPMLEGIPVTKRDLIPLCLAAIRDAHRQAESPA